MKISMSLIVILTITSVALAAVVPPVVKPVVKPLPGVPCVKGTHYYGKRSTKCFPNSDWCSKFNKVTMSCESCNFLYWEQKEQTVGAGQYCHFPTWQMPLLIAFWLVFLGLIFGVSWFFCCKKKAPKAVVRKPLVKCEETRQVEVQHMPVSQVYTQREPIVQVHREAPRIVHHEEPARVYHEPVRMEPRVVHHQEPVRVVQERREPVRVHQESPRQFHQSQEVHNVHRFEDNRERVVRQSPQRVETRNQSHTYDGYHH